MALWPSRNPDQDVAGFEKAFADLAGHKHAIAFPYGRTAQMAILKALDKPGGEVICPSYTCVVVPHAIVKSGMEPVFVDSEETTYNMDWGYVRKATGPKTVAVVATSIFGHPINDAAFENYRRDYPHVTIIQDCAHGYFAGNTHLEGIAAFYGMNISKIMTSIFGGMVSTNDTDLAMKIRTIRDQILTPGGLSHEIRRSFYLIAVMFAFTRPIYRWVNWFERLHLLDHFVKYYDPTKIDLPGDAFVKMGGVEARTGIIQSNRYRQIVKHRRNLAQIYRRKLNGVGDLMMPPHDEMMTVSHFVVRTECADKCKKACLARGIQLGELIDYDCASMPSYQNAKYFGNRLSETFPSQVINLPVHMSVSTRDAIRITEIISEQF